ncbi:MULTISPECIES: DNA translocase FtsK [Sphingomonas]|uniref:DNA translocase FtsK n=1 Tax=Sphingomonas TaxID=13687 RepID=UPI000A7B0833|nr:DNA translocase FtsK [Sphingomonas sp. CCH10-B3]
MTGDRYSEACRSVIESRSGSTSRLQRTMRIGYNEAARLIERMEAQGIVSRPNSAGARQVLVDALPAELGTQQ